MSDVADRIAKPGDPDLVCDLTQLAITSVVVDDGERMLLVRARGGHGRWHDSTNEDVRIDHVGALDLTARLPGMPEHLFGAYVVLLQRWRDTSTPVRYCAAPGRASLLIGDGGEVLPWPRRTDPNRNRHADQ